MAPILRNSTSSNFSSTRRSSWALMVLLGRPNAAAHSSRLSAPVDSRTSSNSFLRSGSPSEATALRR